MKMGNISGLFILFLVGVILSSLHSIGIKRGSDRASVAAGAPDPREEKV